MDLEKKTSGVIMTPESLLDFLLRYATLQTSVGVQTSRVVRNTTRVAEAYGYEITIMMFQRNLAISITGHQGVPTRYSGTPMTALSHHKSLAINFHMNSELTRLSWYAKEVKPSIEDIEAKFEEIKSLPKLNYGLMILLIGCANAAFCFLFGGDLQALAIVALGTSCGFITRAELHKRNAYHYFTVLAAAFVTSFIIGLGISFGLTATPKEALTTSVLYLIPGVPFINSMMDFFDGYILNGLSRLTNAIFIVLSLTIGLSMTLILLNLHIL